MATIVEIQETYFGKGEVRGNKTYLVCRMEPWFEPGPPKNRLVIDVRVPVEGSMVVFTLRYARLRKDGTYPVKGRPVKAIQITYDPNPEPPGVWRGTMKGEWKVRRVPIRRTSVWDRLRKL